MKTKKPFNNNLILTTMTTTTKKTKNKFTYLYVIQYNYSGYGWEDVSEYNKKTERKQAVSDLNEYNFSERGAGGCYRMIERRILNNQN